MSDALKAALGDIKGWAKRGAARDVGKRHGATLPQDSDFPEAVEAEEVETDEIPVPAENAEGLGSDEVDPAELEQLLALLASEG